MQNGLHQLPELQRIVAVEWLKTNGYSTPRSRASKAGLVTLRNFHMLLPDRMNSDLGNSQVHECEIFRQYRWPATGDDFAYPVQMPYEIYDFSKGVYIPMEDPILVKQALG